MRLAWAVPTVLAIVVINFLIMHLAPGDPLLALVGVAAALAGSRRAGGSVGTGITVLSLFGHSVPIFWLGQIFIVVFAVGLRRLPA